MSLTVTEQSCHHAMETEMEHSTAHPLTNRSKQAWNVPVPLRAACRRSALNGAARHGGRQGRCAARAYES